MRPLLGGTRVGPRLTLDVASGRLRDPVTVDTGGSVDTGVARDSTAEAPADNALQGGAGFVEVLPVATDNRATAVSLARGKGETKHFCKPR